MQNLERGAGGNGVRQCGLPNFMPRDGPAATLRIQKSAATD
jgi:hypothetical protein